MCDCLVWPTIAAFAAVAQSPQPHRYTETHRLPGVAPFYRRNSVVNPLPSFLLSHLDEGAYDGAAGQYV
ncbi:MAG: hypothetical protein P4L40_18305 [Terracidiphilus sp.]|nr:hypothetical protein [Terracidiphilus sp.]